MTVPTREELLAKVARIARLDPALCHTCNNRRTTTDPDDGHPTPCPDCQDTQ